MLLRLTRFQAVTLCALPVVALIATAAFAPLPFSVAQPGPTANVLGWSKGTEVITISGAPVRRTIGQLRTATIVVTGPDAKVSLGAVVGNWFRTDRAVMPHNAVYTGNTDEEIERHNMAQMRESQDAATQAALKYLGLGTGKVRIALKLAGVGGPSAGLLFTLGIIDKLDGDGSGGDLTGGRTIAGTGTIDADGGVGAVGGVAQKTQAASRDGATVFLVPKAECADAKAELPNGLRLVPVTTLKSAVNSLVALETNPGSVPSC
ncbi:S16 family serine protease [Streptomyces sp. NPDC006739]|uniref:S16 family serine protease n=1 Tax=Streptomyces sp. NPDC006739 TaxID=3364763 RepID=UPI0036CD292F